MKCQSDMTIVRSINHLFSLTQIFVIYHECISWSRASYRETPMHTFYFFTIVFFSVFRSQFYSLLFPIVPVRLEIKTIVISDFISLSYSCTFFPKDLGLYLIKFVSLTIGIKYHVCRNREYTVGQFRLSPWCYNNILYLSKFDSAFTLKI